MFEQSILAVGATGKRTGAVAAALTFETIAVGILILIPLFYGERLSIVRPWTPINLPDLRTISDPPVTHAARSAFAPSSPAPTRVFRMLTVPRTVPSTTILSDDFAAPLPEIGAGAGPAMPPNAIALPITPIIAPAPAPQIVEPPKQQDQPRPVGGDVQAAKLIRKVIPVYPELARRARVSGTVRLVGIIAKDGTVERLEVISGNPLLVGSAVAAVRQWLYRPTLLDGAAVEVIAPIDVIFTLAK